VVFKLAVTGPLVARGRVLVAGVAVSQGADGTADQDKELLPVLVSVKVVDVVVNEPPTSPLAVKPAPVGMESGSVTCRVKG